uniref:Uncharacterized protein n=1 Tax=Meloidogyne floridensis TaxID=298350 RepID=A0A915NWF6_9BILA
MSITKLNNFLFLVILTRSFWTTPLLVESVNWCKAFGGDIVATCSTFGFGECPEGSSCFLGKCCKRKGAEEDFYSQPIPACIDDIEKFKGICAIAANLGHCLSSNLLVKRKMAISCCGTCLKLNENFLPKQQTIK